MAPTICARSGLKRRERLTSKGLAALFEMMGDQLEVVVQHLREVTVAVREVAQHIIQKASDLRVRERQDPLQHNLHPRLAIRGLNLLARQVRLGNHAARIGQESMARPGDHTLSHRSQDSLRATSSTSDH